MQLEPTPLRGERDRADFEGWNQLNSFPNLVLRPSSFDDLDGGWTTEDECRCRRPSFVFRLPERIRVARTEY
jgi:hypothetical protein